MNSIALNRCLLVCLVLSAGCSPPKPKSPPASPARAIPSRTGSTIERICSITAEQMSVDRAKLTGQTSLADLGADELDLVELVMEMEEEFDVSIPDEAAERLIGSKDWEQGMKNVTLAKLAALVEQQQKLPRDGNLPTRPPGPKSTAE